MQDYDDSRSQGLGTTTTDPEHEAQQAMPASDAPIAAADANGANGTAAHTPTPSVPAQAPASANGTDSSSNDDEGDEGELTMAALLDSPANAMRELQRGEVIEGIVARVDADEVLVDIGQKSEGVIASRELGPAGDSGQIHVGQHLLVYVMQPESAEGHAILSLKRARMEQSWREAEQWMGEDRIIEAPVIDYNKGGLIVDVGVRGFVPISQISELRGLAKGPDSGDSPQVAERLAAMRGRSLKLKIIELNRARNRLILSERLAVQEQKAEKKEALLHELEPGQIRRGRVTSLASFGAFIDLGGADGLVHISQLSYSRVNHPSELLKVGDEVDVYVLSIDPQTKKIALSLKKAQPDPWTLVEERYTVGDVVQGTITKLAKFGAFARIDDGIEGLIHLSELSDAPVEKPQDVVQEGEEVNLRVIAINSQRRRLGLSMRQAQGELRPVEVPVDFDEDHDNHHHDEHHEARGRTEGTAGATAPRADAAASAVESAATETATPPAEASSGPSASEAAPVGAAETAEATTAPVSDTTTTDTETTAATSSPDTVAPPQATAEEPETAAAEPPAPATGVPEPPDESEHGQPNAGASE